MNDRCDLQMNPEICAFCKHVQFGRIERRIVTKPYEHDDRNPPPVSVEYEYEDVPLEGGYCTLRSIRVPEMVKVLVPGGKPCFEWPDYVSKTFRRRISILKPSERAWVSETRDYLHQPTSSIEDALIKADLRQDHRYIRGQVEYSLQVLAGTLQGSLAVDRMLDGNYKLIYSFAGVERAVNVRRGDADSLHQEARQLVDSVERLVSRGKLDRPTLTE